MAYKRQVYHFGTRHELRPLSMLKKRMIFWGASGHAKVLYEFLGHLGYHLEAIFDNNPELSTPFPHVSLYHGIEGFERWQKEQVQTDVSCLVAIGGARGRARL